MSQYIFICFSPPTSRSFCFSLTLCFSHQNYAEFLFAPCVLHALSFSSSLQNVTITITIRDIYFFFVERRLYCPPPKLVPFTEFNFLIDASEWCWLPFGRSPAGALAVLMEFLWHYIRILLDNGGLGDDFFLWKPFQLIIPLSSYHLTIRTS
jgi:hypothetical protein